MPTLFSRRAFAVEKLCMSENTDEITVGQRLPVLSELAASPKEAFKNDEFKLLLNQNPPKAWMKKHPIAKKKVTKQVIKDGKKELKEVEVPSEFIPIDKVELLLDRIFQEWKIEVLREGVMFNSVYCTVRVHYKNPINGQWYWHDGVGAKDVQKDAGSELSASTIKASAVMMALPSAKSYAIKDACEHLGKLFGRDINRRDTIEFSGAYSAKPTPPKSEEKEEERMKALLKNCKTRQELEKLLPDVSSIENKRLYDEMWLMLR